MNTKTTQVTDYLRTSTPMDQYMESMENSGKMWEDSVNSNKSLIDQPPQSKVPQTK